jgi:hypothetical protein
MSGFKGVESRKQSCVGVIYLPGCAFHPEENIAFFAKIPTTKHPELFDKIDNYGKKVLCKK